MLIAVAFSKKWTNLEIILYCFIKSSEKSKAFFCVLSVCVGPLIVKVNSKLFIFLL